MRTVPVRPSGVERTFGNDELIVSKTDPKGIIRYANEIFCDISRYREEQLMGQPHSVIRHPDMPRGVFKLLWDTVGTGRELFAYVVNLASDGAHYWVLAHVTPSFGPRGEIVGYHSNRRSPDRSAIAAVEPLYAAMRAAERRVASGPAQLAASAEVLSRALAERGCGYEEYVWSITPAGAVR